MSIVHPFHSRYTGEQERFRPKEGTVNGNETLQADFGGSRFAGCPVRALVCVRKTGSSACGDLSRRLDAGDRIEFRSGASGNTRVLTDKDQIADFIDKVKDIPFPLQFSQAERSGYGYSITFYEHGERKFGFSTENVKGKYYNIKPDMLKAIKEWAPPML